MKKRHVLCTLVLTGLLLGGCSQLQKTEKDADSSSSSVPVETISVTEAGSASSEKEDSASSASETAASSAASVSASSAAGSSAKSDSSVKDTSENTSSEDTTAEAASTADTQETAESSAPEVTAAPSAEPTETPTPVPTETPAPEPTKTPIVTVEPAEGSNWTAPADVEPLTATAVTEEEAAASAAQTEARRQEVLDAVEFYLATDYWTYDELMDQLKADGFSNSDSLWAMKNCSVDWEIPDETAAADTGTAG